MPVIPMYWYLLVAAGLFGLGAYGALARRNAINVLMGIELMLNAVNLTAVTFWRYVTPARLMTVNGEADRYLAGVEGQVFAIFVIALAAGEVAIGLALVLAIYRLRKSVELDTFELLRG
jgi:NADH:ubiquinone oxidoreductase subunit K